MVLLLGVEQTVIEEAILAMKKSIILSSALSTLALMLVSCSSEPETTTTTTRQTTGYQITPSAIETGHPITFGLTNRQQSSQRFHQSATQFLNEQAGDRSSLRTFSLPHKRISMSQNDAINDRARVFKPHRRQGRTGRRSGDSFN